MARRQPEDPRFRALECDVQWVAEFEGGVLASGSASWRYRLQNRVRAACERAWMDLDPATPASGERLRIGLDAPARVEEPQLPVQDQVPRMYDAFAQACLGRAAPPLGVEEGIADLRFAEAVLASARSGAAVELRADAA